MFLEDRWYFTTLGANSGPLPEVALAVDNGPMTARSLALATIRTLRISSPVPQLANTRRYGVPIEWKRLTQIEANRLDTPPSPNPNRKSRRNSRSKALWFSTCDPKNHSFEPDQPG